MNFTGLQKELRSVGKQIEALEAAVEQMKPKTEEEKKKEYNKIMNLAGRYPLTGRGLEGVRENTQAMYLKMLASLAILASQHFTERLLYISRIAAGMKNGRYTTEKIVELMRQFVGKDLENLYTDLEPAREWFLVDAFATAYLCGEPSEEMIEFTAELAVLMKFSQEDIEILSRIAKGMLTDDFSCLDFIKSEVNPKWCGKFTDSISEKWLAARRICCGKYCTDNGVIDKHSFVPSDAAYECTVKKRVAAGTALKKGDLLVSLEELVPEKPGFHGYDISGRDRKRKTKINAPEDGIVFYIDDEIENEKTEKNEKFVMVYVVSQFDDYAALCKWYKTIRHA